MESKNKDITTVIDHVKESLVIYLNSIATLQSSGAKIDKNTLYEIVDAINTEPPEQEQSNGFLYNLITAPWRFLKFVYSAITYPIHCLLYKSLSDERKDQITYVAKLIQHLESNLKMIHDCDKLDLLDECKNFVLSDLDTLMSNLVILCSATNQVNVEVTIGQQQKIIQGLQNPTTGNTSLGSLLSDKVIKPHDNEAVLQSIEDIVQQNRLVLQATMEKESEKQVKQEEQPSLAQQYQPEEKQKVAAPPEIKPSMEQLKVALREKLSDPKQREAVVARLTEIKKQHEHRMFQPTIADKHGWQEFFAQQERRAQEYSELAMPFTLTGEQRSEKMVQLRDALTKNQSQRVLNIIKTVGDFGSSEFQELVANSPKRNDAVAMLEAGILFDKMFLFNLVKNKLELNATLRQIHQAPHNKETLKHLCQHLWLCNVVTVLIHPSDAHAMFLEKIQQYSDDDLNIIGKEIAGLISINDSLPANQLLNELAKFLLLCSEHLKRLNREKGRRLFQFSHELVLKNAAPSVAALEKQMQTISVSTAKQEKVNSL